MNLQQVDKLRMATEQLEDALRTYFDGRYHSATVLAGAAEQLLAGYVMKHGLKPAFQQERTTITKIANALKNASGSNAERPTTEKEIGDLMTRVYNTSKHAGTKDHVVSMDAKSEARDIIDRAILNYDVLFGFFPEYDLPNIPMAQQFMRESRE